LGEDAQPLARLATTASAEVWVFVGPEGGWTDDELESFRAAGCAMVALTDTVLRVETAAVAAAAVLRCAERAPS
jgi:16S rRNA (uracil1498-N3)-methyltransferase